jgi:uncharacterized membrane protein
VGDRLRHAVTWITAPPRRGLVLAVLVGFVLRLAWSLWAAVEPAQSTSDTAQFLGMARQFADLETYRLNGHVSAFYPPGYPLLLTPLAWASEHSGAFSLPTAAAWLNTIAGTATVVLGALLSRAWMGARTQTPAAWILALAPGPIFLTSAALSETVFTALVLTALLAIADPIDRRRLLALGALIGFTTLVRSPALLLAVIALVALRRRQPSWRSAVRPALALTGGVLLLLLPWTVRNGLQVGAWTPGSTNNAAFLCLGTGDDPLTDALDRTVAHNRRCFTGTPYTPRQADEAAWYPRTIRDAAGWVVSHPTEQPRLIVAKSFSLLRGDRQALADGQDFGRQRRVHGETGDLLFRLCDLWHRVVLVLGVFGAVFMARGRAAWPLWSTALGFVAVVWGGVALDRFHHTTMAILAVFAAGTLTAMGRWAAAGVRARREAGAGHEESEANLSAADGLARSSRPSSVLSGPSDHPVRPVLIALAGGAWVAAGVFDAVSFVSSTEWVYVRGAWLLCALGVAAALVAALVTLVDLLAVPRGTAAFRVGLRHLIALDVALVAFAASFLVRNRSSFDFHDTAEPAALVLSAVGLLALAAATWYGGILTYRYGVRVATDDERLSGFEQDQA